MSTIHQILPSLVYGDAISNHVMEMWRLVRQKELHTRIYANHIDPRYRVAATDYRSYEDRPGNVLIYHYSTGSAITPFVRALKHSRVVIYYHNITPAHFLWDVNPMRARELQQGREELWQLSSLPSLTHAMAGSEYNRLELLDAGFQNVDVVPYIIDLGRLDASARSAQRIRQVKAKGAYTLLFVGRVVPNKCQHDLVHLTRYYHQLIDPKIQLWIAGGFSEASGYVAKLRVLITHYGLDANIKLTGTLGTDGDLAALYQMADAFVCMSEHEGFCIPLIEAMHFGKPVLAYASTSVPFTMGEAGILFREKRFDMVAETLDRLRADTDLRSRVIEGQRQRIKAFDLKTTQTKLMQVLDRLRPE